MVTEKNKEEKFKKTKLVSNKRTLLSENIGEYRKENSIKESPHFCCCC